MRLLAFFLTLVFAGTAIAQQCVEPPVLTNPRTCTISTSGGKCAFGSNEDGIVTFPNQVVTGPVTIEGGRNVHVIGGHIRLDVSARHAMTLRYSRHVFIEGMHVDSNGNCDVFALQNQIGISTKVTLQNVYAQGPRYNVVDGNCHGDLIQNQHVSGGELDLTVENFVGVTRSQGFFIPRYTVGPNDRTTLRNVWVREQNPDEETYGLVWFWSPRDSKHLKHPVSVENVNVGWEGWMPILPETGTWTGDVYDFEEPLITGTVNRWYPDGSDLTYADKTGLNYDRAKFCEIATEPLPEPDPIPADTTPPLVEIVSPPPLVQRRSNQIIDVDAIDDVAILRIEIRINGTLEAVLDGPGFVDWKVPGNPHGRYDIEALAIDTAGNFSTDSITVFATR